MMQVLAIVLLAMVAVRGALGQQQTRWHEYTTKFKTPKNPVDVKLASFVGGPGTEWLSGAAFRTDGTLVVAGTACGPDLTVAGQKATVLGTDGNAPAPIVNSSNVLETINWTRTNSAPFVAWFDPEMKKIFRCVRLPWGTGSACGMAMDDKGDIYLAGKAGPNLSAAFTCRNVTAEEAEKSNGDVFVLKLAADTGKVIWGCTFADAGKGIRIRYHRGNIVSEGEWGYVFRPDGRLDRVVKSGRTKGAKAINPVDWTVATGWDNNTHTHREPWRQPNLRFDFAPESKKDSKTIFNWDPKLVGSDNRHMESDSSIRLTHFDDDGKLWVVGWSDGGNTVFEKQPLDLDKEAPKDGIGFSTWGAGVGSFAHILRISTATLETTGKTLWSGYLTGKNKPSGGSVEQFAVGTDGSPLLTGNIGYGLIQTGDNLSPEKGNAGGPYIAILDPDFSSIRFSSAFLGCGKTKLHTGNSWAPHWNITTQVVKRRHVATFVCGAVKEEQRQMGMVPPPSRNPVQNEFGGGIVDGYIAVIDLGPAAR